MDDALKKLQAENEALRQEVSRLKDEMIRLVGRNLDLADRLEANFELRLRSDVARELLNGNIERQRNADLQDDAQLKALEEINQMLEELRAINTAIQGQGPYILRVNKRQSIIIEENLSARIETVLRIQRDRRIKEITTKASKYRILLDEEERQLLQEGTAAVPNEE